MAAQETSAKANNDYLSQLLKEQEGLNSQCTAAYKLLQQGKLMNDISHSLQVIFAPCVSEREAAIVNKPATYAYAFIAYFFVIAMYSVCLKHIQCDSTCCVYSVCFLVSYKCTDVHI